MDHTHHIVTSDGNGRHGPSLALVERKADSRTEASDARMDTRVARLEHRTDLNDLRAYVRPLAQAFFLGEIDHGLQLVGDLDAELRRRLDRLAVRS